MPFKDPSRKREYRREWYHNNKASELIHVKRRKDSIKKWLENYKSNLVCSKCGENHPATIDFHHKKGYMKERAISQLVYDGYSINKIKEELNKCEILCANCHRKLHYKNKNL
jgi:hypothetical protein